MAPGTGGRKGVRKRAGPKPGRATAAPRPQKPVLGNDPFTRGAAPRVPAPAAPTPVGATPNTSPAALRRALGERDEVSARGRQVEPRALTSRPIAALPAEALQRERSDAAEAAPRSRGAAPSPTPPRGRTPSPAGSERPSGADPHGRGASARLSDVERRLDSALDGLESRLAEVAARAGLGHARAELGEALRRLLPALRSRLVAAVDLARLLEPPERLDRFGMDPRLAERAEPLVELLYSSWWRVAVRDPDRVPSAGPAIVVANHAGLVPWDALVLRHALRRDHPAARDLRPLLDDRELDLPVLGGIALRLGAVRADPEAAERVLADGSVLGVFPEGSAGARKPWRDRYRIQRFGRGGFAKIALRARAPIIPCAIVGSEEASPGISRIGWLAERLGIPLLSASSLLTVGPAALVPLPSKWSIRFGAPVEVRGHAPEAADDPAVVAALTDRVRSELQAMLDEDVAGRSSVFL